MVNNHYRLLEADNCKVKSSARNGQLITNGPVYDLALAKKMLCEHGLTVINELAKSDQVEKFDPEMEEEELRDFVLALTPENFCNSERCATSAKIYLDCDSYAMTWNRNRRIRWDYGKKLYVKFGFSAETNSVLFILCIHPARW